MGGERRDPHGRWWLITPMAISAFTKPGRGVRTLSVRTIGLKFTWSSCDEENRCPSAGGGAGPALRAHGRRVGPRVGVAFPARTSSGGADDHHAGAQRERHEDGIGPATSSHPFLRVVTSGRGDVRPPTTSMRARPGTSVQSDRSTRRLLFGRFCPWPAPCLSRHGDRGPPRRIRHRPRRWTGMHRHPARRTRAAPASSPVRCRSSVRHRARSRLSVVSPA